MIQVIGTKKCKVTQKALRFFKDRSVIVHFRDVLEQALSKGELDNCSAALGGISTLIDKESAAWKQRGLSYMEFDTREELLNDMNLLKTPIVRKGKLAVLGNDETAWKSMAVSEKS